MWPSLVPSWALQGESASWRACGRGYRCGYGDIFQLTEISCPQIPLWYDSSYIRRVCMITIWQKSAGEIHGHQRRFCIYFTVITCRDSNIWHLVSFASSNVCACSWAAKCCCSFLQTDNCSERPLYNSIEVAFVLFLKALQYRGECMVRLHQLYYLHYLIGILWQHFTMNQI